MRKAEIPIHRIIKNNFQMAGAVFRADAGYAGFTLLVRMLSGIGSTFLYVYLLGAVIYCVENGKEPGTILIFLLCGIAFLAVVFALQAYYRHVFAPVRRERIVGGLQQELFDRLQAADMANYDSAMLYTKVTLANEEVAVRPLEITDNLFRGLEGLTAVCAIFAGILPANWFVMGICVVSFAAGIFLAGIRSGQEVQYDEQMKRKDKKLSLLRRLLYLPEYGKDNRLSHVHKVFLDDYRNTVMEKEQIAAEGGRRIGNLSFFQKIFCSAFCIDFLIPLYLSMAVLLWGKLPISAFVVAVNAGDQIQRRLDVFLEVIAAFLKNGRLAERIRDLDNIQCDIEVAGGVCPASGMRKQGQKCAVRPEVVRSVSGMRKQGAECAACPGPVRSVPRMQILELHNVSFVYPDGTPGLSGIDLTIRKGSKVAVVGRNGSGKTTLIKLLLRFYDAESGSILQNGTDIRNFAVSSYRAQFGIAFQDFNIYAASVRDNVCMGEAPEEGRLIQALERAGLHDGSKGTFVNPDAQLTRELEESGILLSGGQLQRLALARVFYRDSDIVIMDEPTAAMDVFFEKEFYRTVFEQLKDRTVIFVSHRLSSVTACDTIVHMEHGKILEEGTHEELMGLQGGYYRLFRAQFE